MTPRLILTFGMSALLLGGTVVGCAGGMGHIATASDRSVASGAKLAARKADGAARMLAKGDAANAVTLAEAAVELAPRDAGYRLLLGQAYQQSGRFVSARDTFADVVQLDPANGKAALALALAQTATGDWAAARTTLDTHAAIIPVGDLGLATALAGNPAGAVAILNAAARAPGADAKVRQNLALSYALAGQWTMARVAAAADLSAADLDARLEQWAAFAQPRGAADQVASLLGVTPVADVGRPATLALVPAAAVLPGAPPPVRMAAAVPAPAAAPFAGVVFAPRKEVVQPLATMLTRGEAAPARLAAQPAVRLAARPVPASRSFAAAPATGEWYVQLGAFPNVALAKTGWASATRRFTALADHQPTGTPVAAPQGSFYRLSVGGFARAQADAMCSRYRARGGACFVRREAGDRMAQWLRGGPQVASR